MRSFICLPPASPLAFQLASAMDSNTSLGNKGSANSDLVDSVMPPFAYSRPAIMTFARYSSVLSESSGTPNSSPCPQKTLSKLPLPSIWSNVAVTPS